MQPRPSMQAITTQVSPVRRRLPPVQIAAGGLKPGKAAWTKVGQEESAPSGYYGDMALTGHRRPHLTTLAIRRKGIVTIPEAIREELDLHEGDHLVATVEDGRLILIPASVIPDDQAWFWTPEWQAREAEADQEIAAGGAPVMSADEFITELAQRAGLSADDLT
jgi:AbrB family looped-hinge helix DNA binding protein